jgi:putative FmdB family regulatory protein
MPNYEYLCKNCGHRFEQIRKFSDKPLRKCPECGGVIEQVISAPAVQFKGSGWYVTDYAKKGAASEGSPSSSSEGGGATKEAKDSKDTKDTKDAKDTKDTRKDDKPKSDSSQKKHKKD